MSGVKLFFLLLLGVLVCIACVVIGQYQLSVNKTKQSKKPDQKYKKMHFLLKCVDKFKIHIVEILLSRNQSVKIPKNSSRELFKKVSMSELLPQFYIQYQEHIFTVFASISAFLSTV